jgi:cytochrome d ubiquinol oxidase subunit II
MLTAHGAAYVYMKTTEEVAERARRAGIVTSLLTFVFFLIAGICIYAWIKGYRISSPIDHAGPSNPLRKTVDVSAGAWFQNYWGQPWSSPNTRVNAR